MKNLAIIFVLILSSSPWEVKGAAVNAPGIWFKTEGQTKAVALLAQGLNFKAEKMDSLAQVMQKKGIEVFRLSFTGLNGHDMPDLINATPEIWRKDFRVGYAEVARRSKELNVPIYFVGFSLGASVAMNEMTQSDSVTHFNRMALFAPAISLRPMTKLLHVLRLFGKGFCLPSKNLPEYRVYPCTPMGAYGALLDGISEFHSQRTSAENVPTVVFIDPQDELVNLTGLKELVQQRGLNQWTFFEINENETLLPRRIHHLIIDERAVGPRQWEEITNILSNHFGGVSTPIQ